MILCVQVLFFRNSGIISSRLLDFSVQTGNASSLRRFRETRRKMIFLGLTRTFPKKLKEKLSVIVEVEKSHGTILTKYTIHGFYSF